MPTATGLPKVGEVWELHIVVLGKPEPKRQFVVLERGRGDYWSMKVAIPVESGWARTFWVDCAHWMKQGWLRYVGPAGPKTRREVGLLCRRAHLGLGRCRRTPRT